MLVVGRKTRFGFCGRGRGRARDEGGAKEGNFVVTAAPALLPAAAWERLWRGLLWLGWKPGPSEF
jgi:hypothetical protein